MRDLQENLNLNIIKEKAEKSEKKLLFEQLDDEVKLNLNTKKPSEKEFYKKIKGLVDTNDLVKCLYSNGLTLEDGIILLEKKVHEIKEKLKEKGKSTSDEETDKKTMKYHKQISHIEDFLSFKLNNALSTEVLLEIINGKNQEFNGPASVLFAKGELSLRGIKLKMQ